VASVLLLVFRFGFGVTTNQEIIQGTFPPFFKVRKAAKMSRIGNNPFKLRSQE
jgi:hypothetical protein